MATLRDVPCCRVGWVAGGLVVKMESLCWRGPNSLWTSAKRSGRAQGRSQQASSAGGAAQLPSGLAPQKKSRAQNFKLLSAIAPAADDEHDFPFQHNTYQNIYNGIHTQVRLSIICLLPHPVWLRDCSGASRIGIWDLSCSSFRIALIFAPIR
jgi:hypothetical protein